MTHWATNPHLLIPDWEAPPTVAAVVTLRTGGQSRAPFATLNLGDHVGDEPRTVRANRQQLAEWTGLPLSQMQWLTQVHGTELVKASPEQGLVEADAVWSDQPGTGCVVMTADCLPVFFCSTQGDRVAVAHAGWRGLVNGVLESTLAIFEDPAQVLVWLGPAIGPMHFEVGDEVYQQFVAAHPDNRHCFRPSPNHPSRWYADLYQLARGTLERCGVRRISGGDFCTYSDSERFFSYRRDGQTGRMASLIWLR